VGPAASSIWRQVTKMCWAVISFLCVVLCVLRRCHYPNVLKSLGTSGVLRHTVVYHDTQNPQSRNNSSSPNRERGNHLWFASGGLEFNKSHSTRNSTMAHHNAFVRALTKMPQGTAIGISVGVTCVFSALLTVMFTSKGKAASFVGYRSIF
jgi:hypothetical protein